MEPNPPIFLIGWSLVFLTLLINAVHGNAVDIFLNSQITIILCGLATLSLLRYPALPKQRVALRTSWVGPLLLSSYAMTYKGFIYPSFEAADGILAAKILIARMCLQGCVSVAFMVWLFRGYGLIAFIAMAATIRPGTVNWGKIRITSFATEMEKAAETYPYRWWWFTPVVVLVGELTKIMFVAWMFWQIQHDLNLR